MGVFQTELRLGFMHGCTALFRGRRLVRHIQRLAVFSHLPASPRSSPHAAHQFKMVLSQPGFVLSSTSITGPPRPHQRKTRPYICTPDVTRTQVEKCSEMAHRALPCRGGCRKPHCVHPRSQSHLQSQNDWQTMGVKVAAEQAAQSPSCLGSVGSALRSNLQELRSFGPRPHIPPIACSDAGRRDTAKLVALGQMSGPGGSVH